MREQDIIITLVILAVSGLSALLQKKRQAREHGQLDHPDRPVAPPTTRESTPPSSEPKPFDLEEQLRRILEGDRPEPPPAPAPPPIQVPRPAPPPLPDRPRAEVIYVETEKPLAAPAIDQLPEAVRGFERAQLPGTVGTHSRRADEATAPAGTSISARPARATSPVAAAAITQLRTRQSVQQAFVTATILGRPKAFSSFSSPEN
ncbi:MAG: hypothetical protein L0Z50_04700 [Verrucomicrobiales bacterium]|nr:hypothetical protein [Verrucomicrobiales bacterium]